MRKNDLKAISILAGRASIILLLAAAALVAQQQVNLTAGPATAVMPDGTSVPMWGYTCTALPSGTTSTATCAALNKAAAVGVWSPVIITVPSGQGLTINLTNNLPIPPGSATGVPTSLTIVGQLGGGLGTPTSTPSPTHTSAGITWSTPNSTVNFVPPTQGPRVQSFGTEVATGATTALTWSNLRPGTYLLESGTHPSIQGPMGLYGMVVVTTAPAGQTPGTAYTNVNYDADVPLLLSEIDPVQNNAVNAAVNTAGFSETMVWSGQPGGCGNASSPTYQQCYPPAVNYSPLYYLFNGAAFDKTNTSASTFAATVGSPAPTGTPTGSILVRFVNAGLRMHVPAIVGSQTGTSKAPGFSLIAEDGNPLPGLPRVQSEVFMAAGKTYDVMINGPATPASALPVYDRELSLSGNATSRDAGMLAYLSVNGASLPSAAALSGAVANPDTYPSVVPGVPLTVSDPSKGVMANDVNVYGVKVMTAPAQGKLVLNSNGTFTYTPNTNWAGSDSFVYIANGNPTLTATVTLGAATVEDATKITVQSMTFTSTAATYFKIGRPGVLAGAKDTAGYPLTVAVPKLTVPPGMTVQMSPDGGFTAIVPGPGTYSFSFQAQNSQGTLSAAAMVSVIFPNPSNLAVSVVDGSDRTTPIADYRWIIEEDRSFYVDPNNTTNTTTSVPVFGVNFHTSNMPFVAQGCTGPNSCEAQQTVYDPNTGTHINAVCDVGNGICRPDAAGMGLTQVLPSQVVLDPTKRYYISVLPGDAGDPAFMGGATGHGMGGAPISAGQTAVTVLVQPTPYQPAKLSVFVFEDDYPLNGEHDAGGGVDVLAPNEPGLGGFQIHLWDAMGQNGDFTGQMSYDMFNQPLTNSLAGTIDPATMQDACPISPGSSSTFNGFNSGPYAVSASATGAGNTITITGLTVDNSQIGNTLVISGGKGFTPGTYTIASVTPGDATKGTPGTWTLTPAVPGAQAATGPASAMTGTRSAPGITGMIVTCPKYESDGTTLSPLAGQAVINNLMPGRWGVIATPAADRIARGEEWLQTNTLDGQKAHDVFTRIGEPSYFQEYGPASYHVTIGFANPATINGRLADVCNGMSVDLPGQGGCNNTLTGRIVGEHLSRPPDERLYPSGSRDAFYWSQCYVSVGDPDGIDFAFAKCDANGTFTLTGLPSGNWRITTFDQWNDQLVDGLSTPVALGNSTALCPGSGSSTNFCNIGDIAATQWQTNLYTRTFVDDNKDGVSQKDEAGIPLVNVAVRLRDGSVANALGTDFNGIANFNETFPLFSWYVVETDVTRYKNTGTHVVYDAGGPPDGSPACGQSGYPACGTSVIAKNLANTVEQVPLPANMRVPGAVYCTDADCSSDTLLTHPSGGGTGGSTGRIDPPWVGVEGWQGFPGQNSFIEFGKTPYVAGENGGIKGHVVYASTRPFDDPQLLVQTQWEPLVPHVTINLYQEGFAADHVSPTLTLVDTTQTSSFDDWAQGFRSDGMPNMNCPGQSSTNDLFFFTLKDQPNYLNTYNAAHGGAAVTSLPMNSQFKCYDGMHNWNQVQPAPYDGMYKFPSVTAIDPTSGKLMATNCTICTPNPTDGTPMLPTGKYVVEVVVPPGYELVKEEDKNILIGDNFIAPVTQQFGGLGNVFILPDQAQVGSAYNANNAQNPTQSFGSQPANGIVPGFVPEPVWPCVGQARIVPDYISLFPQSKQIAPFAGATRNLCDRKEVTLGDQMGAIAKFYVYTSTHIASKFTGGITDDFTSEFDPFSPQFGEKFAPPDLPVSIKDFTGTEISRVYADHWGAYNGMTYSTWDVNPPNPTGYAPQMMILCMNDAGTGSTPDPLFNPAYSQFCYELPFMPGTTQYLDTPVVPTSAFSEGYNHPDCAYPDATPAISEVDGDGTGPWVSTAGNSLIIKSLGDQSVTNYGYSGPSATVAPFNQKTVTRHYGFGSTQGTVTIGGVPATVSMWSDSQIKVTVPTGVPDCAIQQQTIYGGSKAQCGQLLITAANGQQSIDSVTVTIGGKAPTPVTAGTSIQSVIDNANPGDLIMVGPGSYNELLIMWKPVRLQGVGASSTVINANAHPAGKLDPWRAKVSCLFGLATNGQPFTGDNVPTPTNTNPFDPTGTYTCGGWPGFVGVPNSPQVDRIPLEGVVGWDTTTNGNLAQLLQEPTLLGAYEGAGILVLSKGVNVPPGSGNYYGNGAEATFPTGSVVLTSQDCTTGTGNTNPWPSNFQCNPSAIDGLSITNSSQGGGGIFVHAWGHNLQIANNRVYNNVGTLTGGINIGQGDAPDIYAAGTAADVNPGSCRNVPTDPVNLELPYCFNMHVNIHNNMVTSNTAIGDELFSATPAGAGGVTFCNGSDYYQFQYNWVCGNMSTGDGGGMAHLGFSWNGDIEHNSFLFNQSLNPTIATNGGGLVIQGAAPDGMTAAGLECGGTAADADCSPGLPDGTGPGLVINANIIMGNAAESGSGGGLRLQSVNGTDITAFPNGNPTKSTTPGATTPWNTVTITNNIIANNVAGWDGGGISMQDALAVNIVNNTIVSNDTTASSGVLFNTIGAPLASAPGATNQTTSPNTSAPQPAGVVSMQNSANLTSALASVMPSIVCPAGHSPCNFSNPILANNLIWQNRAFYIGVGALSPQYQQNIVSLYNAFTTTMAASQTATGACPTGSSYWDLGVRGDTGPRDHSSMFTLAPTYSVLSDTTGYDATNLNADPMVISQYCNGSRVPPENQDNHVTGWQVPPGISDATVPNPIFSLTPAATVDEGNNWVNMQWGPLAMTHPVTGAVLGNYSLQATSPAIDVVPSTSATYGLVPATDFFGNPRPDPGHPGSVDIGAVEFQKASPKLTAISPNTGALGYTVPVTLTGTGLNGATAITVSGGSDITVSNINPVSDTSVTANFAISKTAALTARTVNVTSALGVSNNLTFTVVRPPVPTLTSIAPASGFIGAAVPVTINGTSLLTATAVTVSGSGVSVTGLTAVSDTQLTATFTIAANATQNARMVTVTTLAATGSNAVTFTVMAPPLPVLTSIAPVSGVRGTTVPITLTGMYLTGTSALNIGTTAITVQAGSLTVLNDSTVTANLVIAGGTTAPLGNTTISATTLGGTSNTETFTVLGPTLTSISPAMGAQGATVPVTLTGTNLGGATAITVPSGSGITVSNFSAVNATTVTATFKMSSSATLTSTDAISVSTSIGPTNTVNFSVVPAPPTLSSISPTSGTQGASPFTVTLTGTNLTGGTVNVPPGSGITVTNVVVSSSTKITATFTIASGATIGPDNITVTTSGGPSNPVVFNVLRGAPSLNSISPNSGFKGAQVPVTLTGVNLTGATSITISGTGVTLVANTLTVVNDTTVTATFAIASNASTNTMRNVSVTTPSGTSGTVTFSVMSPILNSISPNSGIKGQSVPVTITATGGLTGATGLSIGGSGVSYSLFKVVNDTTITATLNLTSSASTNIHTVSVIPVGGLATNTQNFTVVAETLSSITPSQGVKGTTVSVTIKGNGGLLGSTGLNIGGSGVGFANFAVVDDMTVTANLVIASSAGTGNHTVSVATPGGNTSTVNFNVVAPTLTSVSPSSGLWGTSVPVTLTGTGFGPAGSNDTVTLGSTGVTVSNVTVISDTQINATFNIALGANTGNHTVTVTNAGGAATGTFNFSVTSVAPTISNVTPASGTHSTTVPVTINGTNFFNGATVSVTGGVTVTNVVVVSSTQITCSFVLPTSTGTKTVTVKTTGGGGTSNGVTFTSN